MSAAHDAPRTLLATMTNEPFQPVRLYYAVSDASSVMRRLGRLECMAECPDEGCWHWLFHAEAASLRFRVGYHEIPKEIRPILLGRIHFPNGRGMTLQTNSIPRAIEAARFFGPRLGSEAVASRCRVINRHFAATEGDPDELMKSLDRDVTVIDPRQAEEELRRDLKDVRTIGNAERVAAQRLERRLANRDDVPLVEDFPLAPEEETADFTDLSTALGLRLIRALEHWRGNTDATLISIIKRFIDESSVTRGDAQP